MENQKSPKTHSIVIVFAAISVLLIFILLSSVYEGRIGRITSHESFVGENRFSQDGGRSGWDISDWIIAFASVGMFVVAWMQLRETNAANERFEKFESDGHLNTKKELRAYLHVDTEEQRLSVSSVKGLNALFKNEKGAQNPPPDLSYNITLKNYGQTPAHAVQFIFEDYVVAKDSFESRDLFSDDRFKAAREGVKVIEASGGEIPHTAPIGPGQSHVFTIKPLSPIANFEKIKEDKLALHVWGTVFYRDVFGDPHETKFRFAHIPGEHEFGPTFKGCNHGTDAT